LFQTAVVAVERGVSLIPRIAADADPSKRRRDRSLWGDKPTRTIAMIWRQNRNQGPLVRWFIEALRREGRRRSR
jgi:DNA-binding transcriptional LysR family regulator